MNDDLDHRLADALRVLPIERKALRHDPDLGYHILAGRLRSALEQRRVGLVLLPGGVEAHSSPAPHGPTGRSGGQNGDR